MLSLIVALAPSTLIEYPSGAFVSSNQYVPSSRPFTVNVPFTATKVSVEVASLSANTSRNETEMGKTEVKGYTGTITLTKYAEDGKTILKGAEFKLYKATKDKVKEENSGVSALRFIKLGDGIYKLALADNEATSTFLPAFVLLVPIVFLVNSIVYLPSSALLVV